MSGLSDALARLGRAVARLEAAAAARHPANGRGDEVAAAAAAIAGRVEAAIAKLDRLLEKEAG
ncbi:MAG: hypothetical protein E6G72_15305 [Alphaproteobacteria bacterium]|nr:MAG: hypothetical protein E6G72_15305 [Alphaproteobacteria bacterium]